MRRRLGPLVPIVAIVVTAAVVGASCSSSSGSANKNNNTSTTTGAAGTTQWKAARLTEIAALAAKLTKAFPADCTDFAPYKPAEYLPQATKF